MVNGYEGGKGLMVNAYIGLRQIVTGIESERDFLTMIAAYYASECYGYYLDGEDDNLLDFNRYVDSESLDLLTNIQNTLANVDNAFSEEDESCEDYCEGECEEECDEMDDETKALMERNRRLNEQALGL